MSDQPYRTPALTAAEQDSLCEQCSAEEVFGHLRNCAQHPLNRAWVAEERLAAAEARIAELTGQVEMEQHRADSYSEGIKGWLRKAVEAEAENVRLQDALHQSVGTHSRAMDRAADWMRKHGQAEAKLSVIRTAAKALLTRIEDKTQDFVLDNKGIAGPMVWVNDMERETLNLELALAETL